MVPRSLVGVGLLLGVLAVAAAVPPLHEGSEPSPPPVLSSVSLDLEIVAQMCPSGYDNGVASDDVCLTYNGTIPGPTLVFREGDAVTLTVHNRVDQTVAGLPVMPTVKNKFLGKPFSLHRHGTDSAANMDGVGPHALTQLEDSRVPASGTFVYTFTTPFVGTWQYHDHAFGPQGLGTDGSERGLFGSLIVLPAAAPSTTIFDLHLLDEGPNGGLGLNGQVAVGERFLLALAGLGNDWWDVQVTDPGGSVLATHTLAPGVSHGVLVESAQAGAYTWRATSPFHPGSFQGQVVAS